MNRYSFNEKNEFVIEGYDKAKTFSSFLPGVVGIDGIPMWSFYVNRGQGIGSFGVGDKNSTIMEFFPANLMYKNIELNGFRTFIKYNGQLHEIFSSISKDEVIRKMYIEKNILKVEEINKTLNIKVLVTYFTMPKESFAAMVRKVEVENLDNTEKEIEILDGMPQILAYGVSNSSFKEMANLNRAFVDVFNMENNVPYYKVRATTNDSSEVGTVDKGNFYASFSNKSNGMIKPIVDMDVIFGKNTSLLYPEGWTSTIEELKAKKQIYVNKISGGFTAETVKLIDKYTLCTVIGHASTVELVNNKVKEFSVEYIERKEKEAIELINDLVSLVNTNTSNKLFDQYIEQCYLDNVLRGGYPLIFEGKDHNHVYHVYSRKHGDMEREYNFFSLEPAYYSQGNGNFRDVNQNRRNDILFNPKVEDFNVKQFMSLIQLDGYNPLVVKGSTFKLNQDKLDEMLSYVKDNNDSVKNILSNNFTPGMLINHIINEGIEITIDSEELLANVLKESTQVYEASFGEGYWSDHWTYNMDLVESYLKVYPDKMENFVFDDDTYKFFESPEIVLKRSEKYVLAKGKVRQYNSIMFDKEKCETLNIDRNATNWSKVNGGTGKIYETNLFVKMLTLALTKFTIMDPCGIGVEMEGDKPGWNDAMNGLPGLFGSSINETSELKRVVDFLVECSSKFDKQVNVPIEISNLLFEVRKVLALYENNELNDFEYWDKIATLREDYRDSIRFGVSGEEVAITTNTIKEIFESFASKINAGLDKALEIGNGIYPTYLYYNAKEYEVLEGKKNPVSGYDNVKVKEFELNSLPLFLEGPCRTLKVINDKKKAKDLYEKIKASNIYDNKLKMYKTSESIEDSSFEIGRAKAFTAGWLERESVFMHMEYKYLLEVLKAGLYDEFFDDIQTMMVPFLNPEVYGRSTLENSSFIASSVNPDEEVHGQGFVARLSGSTAEMLSMWYNMMVGNEGFTFNNGELQLIFNPILPAWLFNDNKISFNFLGDIKVTYINNKNLNTFGNNKVQAKNIEVRYKDDIKVSVEGNVLNSKLANDIRSKLVKTIDITLE